MALCFRAKLIVCDQLEARSLELEAWTLNPQSRSPRASQAKLRLAQHPCNRRQERNKSLRLSISLSVYLAGVSAQNLWRESTALAWPLIVGHTTQTLEPLDQIETLDLDTRHLVDLRLATFPSHQFRISNQMNG